LGAVRAGLELAEQVRGGLLPEPDFVYVSYGTGGTAAGLALGLPLGGLRPEIRAVAAVERWWTTRRRLAALDAAARALLDTEKLRDSRTVTACPLLIVRDQLGPAYGVATPASDGATRRLRDLGVPIEPLYSGKAMAALLAAAPAMRGRRVLFWQTARGPLPASSAEWDQRLPSPLRARLWRLGALPAPVPAGFPAVGPTRLALSRRALLLGLASAALAGLAQRLRGYALPEGQPPGLLLAPWELCVLSAAAEALLPESPGPLAASGPDAWTVAANVDRYLVGAPPTMRREIRALLALTEHGAGLAGRGRRMSRMGAVDRREWLLALRSRGTVMAQAVRGLRDLCLLGYWQDPRTWVEIGYGGPLLPPPGAGIPRRADGLPLRAGRTDSLCAAPGALPRSRVP
jgi:D-cysteine desulfhydrase